MNFTKYILIVLLSLFFTACEQRPFLYHLENKQITLHNPISNATLETINIGDVKPFHFNDTCTRFSHSLDFMDNNFGNLYVQNIVLNHNCKFLEQERGSFEYFLKFRSKLKSMKLLKRKEVKHYEFSQYLIDDKYKINLIYIWEVRRATFILDYKGVLTNHLMKKLQINEQFELNDINYSINPPVNMVQDNQVHEFWGRE